MNKRTLLKWCVPVVTAVVLPAHAQTTTDVPPVVSKPPPGVTPGQPPIVSPPPEIRPPSPPQPIPIPTPGTTPPAPQRGAT